MAMTSRQRMLAALERRQPDRLPVTTHHVMPYFLNHTLGGISTTEFFERFGLDGYAWTLPLRAAGDGEWIEDAETPYAVHPDWQVTARPVRGMEVRTTAYTIHTPGGELTLTLQTNEQTTWLIEHPIKRPSDIDLLQYLPAVEVEAAEVAATRAAWGERGLVRGHIPGFDFFGQPGTWQDAACLVGIQALIMATYDDPAWVHELLGLLNRRKQVFLRSLAGAPYDLLELGGGDASSTVISPRLFDRFVAPYDAPLIELAHSVGQRVVYHTCGGMMPLLERIADMGPDAMETFTPVGMGGDVDLAEAKRRIGQRVCMIGGFDQFHFFTGCAPAETRAEVRRCFDAAGAGGGLILSPSDHFFEAEPELLEAFADEARRCVY